MTNPLSIEPDDHWKEDQKWEEDYPDKDQYEEREVPKCSICEEQFEWDGYRWVGTNECCKKERFLDE